MGPDIIDNFAAGEAYCIANFGSHLASIRTEQDFIDAQAACQTATNGRFDGGSDCLTGMKDDITEGIWYNADGADISGSYGFNSDGTATGSNVDPTIWWPGSPSNSNGVDPENCLVISSFLNLLYNDVKCNDYPYLLPMCNPPPSPTQSPTTSEPTTYSPTQTPTTGTPTTGEPTHDPTVDCSIPIDNILNECSSIYDDIVGMVSQNSDDIQGNMDKIQGNADEIAGNAAKILELEDDVEMNEDNIADNAANIDINKVNITNILAIIDGLEERIYALENPPKSGSKSSSKSSSDSKSKSKSKGAKSP